MFGDYDEDNPNGASYGMGDSDYYGFGDFMESEEEEESIFDKPYDHMEDLRQMYIEIGVLTEDQTLDDLPDDW